MRVYNTYIKGKNCVVLSCVPKGKAELKAHDETWKMYTRNIQSESAEYKNLSYTEPKDNFVRSKMPDAKAASLVPVPDFWIDKTSNNIKLIGVTSNEIPKVNILLSFKAGHRYETKEKAGVSSLLASLMGESTTQHSSEDIEKMLDKLGSSISVNSNSEEFQVSISCLKTNLDATLKLAEEIIFSPKFDKEDFELVKKEQLDGLAQQQTSAANIANNIYSKLIYGPEHILGINGDGTPETVANISLEDVKTFYNGLSSNETSIAISGDVKKEEVVSKLAFLSKLKKNIFCR